MIAALLMGALLAAGPATPPSQQSKAKEKDELIQKLKRDIFKVDRSIRETEKLITSSRNAPYLPDLQFRLAELYVEKSRYIYYLQAETRPAGAKGAMISPETKLFKQKAVQMYERLLREYPTFHDGDKVLFYLAHERRELGEFDDMMKTLDDLTHKYPQSPLRLEAEQILGDHFFDRADLNQAEKHYRAVLEAPPSPVHDLARYKMGWIRINQANHSDAVNYFEAAAASEPIRGTDAQKSLNVKREALLDLVYSYTEARPPKGALNYFEKLSDSRTTYALALDKLGNRYFIKQQYEWAVPALRRLLEVQPDPALDMERSQKLYDAVKASKGKVNPDPVDVRYLVRAAVEVKLDPERKEPERKKELATLEEMARDLATQLHVAAQKEDRKQSYLTAAQAYKEYLALFRPQKNVRTMMKNRADALFAAKSFPQAAEQFEELLAYEKAAKDREETLYGALLSHYESLKPGVVEKLNAFQVSDARQALKLLGAKYVSQFPRAEHVTEIKFNIARASYDDGDFERSGELFKAFALSHPDHKDATVAGHLALDSFRQRSDFAGLEATAKAFLGSRLPANFLAEVKRIATESKSDALGELALKSSNETGDVVEGLLKVADENKGGDLGEKALFGAFAAAREKRDLAKQRELGARFIKDYPKSPNGTDILLSLGRNSAEAARFEEAASYYEQLGQRSSAADGWLNAARLRAALGQHREAIRNYEAAAEASAPGARGDLMMQAAEQRLKIRDAAQARAKAEQVLRTDKLNAPAAAMLAELSAADSSLSPKAKEALVAQVSAVAQGPSGQSEDGARAMWYVAELYYRDFKQLPPDQVEQKVTALQQLDALYTQVAQMGSPEWAVASLWRVASSYQHLADSVEATPVPSGLAAAEVLQFKTAVREQVAALRQRSDNAFNACVSRAESLDVFTAASMGCRAKQDTAKPSYPNPGSPISAARNVEELLRKLEQNADAATVEQLGLVYLAAHQLPLSQLTLSRAVELEDARPSSHNALGWSYLQDGKGSDARAEYGKALEADPRYEKARANLAALRCRFGDREGAAKELSLIKDTSALTGPDVDPEWKSCR